ncbi:hypothetical protein AAT19DRAFT_12365, partial [Rhodotorula toruloides]
MSSAFDTPATSTAKSPEAPAAAHAEQDSAVTSPSSSNEQAKEHEEVEGEQAGNDQAEGDAPVAYPYVEREGAIFAFTTTSGIPLASPYPCEEQIRRRYEEEAESAEKTAKAAAASQGAEEEQDEEENGFRDPSFPSAEARRGPSKISFLTGASDLSPAACLYPPEQQRRRKAEDKADTEI